MARDAVTAEAVEDTILALTTQLGPEKTICPSDAARALAGNDPEIWRRLMPDIRRVAIRLMKEGRVLIKRKGRVVDPDDFRGVYRIAVAPSPPEA
ncbi:MAG: DUF3253 domain-containing protein [Methylobacteriaceae bacterium]|nr:DUF3253 domain-containing protein [Methylobacteriaceae bacterium]